MKASTYKQFLKLNRKVDALTELVRTLTDQVGTLTQQSEDRAAAKKLATDIADHGTKLQGAVDSIPKTAA
jgi:uncharacterized protein YoxC